ncbi:MAG: D-aminoacyl-tRNA deacylase [Chloroflexota bacterium]|nr:D-aminoacyl-tRNA deacylase [Dehalococcoidia bacterium]MDW8252396.1 D-aminoacyl-tRNA deacylase [Chloroflexota bacterium]
MRAVVQRVTEARVSVDGTVVGAIGRGLLILLGVAATDTPAVADAFAEKIATLRIFPNEAGKFDRSLLDIGGEALVVSQFTLFADTRRGRRPSFLGAGPPELAAPLVDRFADALRAHGIRTATGVFGAMMQVALVNDGPVTIVLNTEEAEASRSARADPSPPA